MAFLSFTRRTLYRVLCPRLLARERERPPGIVASSDDRIWFVFRRNAISAYVFQANNILYENISPLISDTVFPFGIYHRRANSAGPEGMLKNTFNILKRPEYMYDK